MAYMNTHHPTLTQLQQLTATWQEPHFIYRNRVLAQRAQQLMALTAPYGLTVRYAMKANNHPQIIRLLADAGLQFDARSCLILVFQATASAYRASSQPIICRRYLRRVCTTLRLPYTSWSYSSGHRTSQGSLAYALTQGWVLAIINAPRQVV